MPTDNNNNNDNRRAVHVQLAHIFKWVGPSNRTVIVRKYAVFFAPRFYGAAERVRHVCAALGHEWGVQCAAVCPTYAGAVLERH